MHRLLYSAAPLLAGSLAMSPALASPLTEYCDRSNVHITSGSGDAAGNTPRCPFCRMPPDADGRDGDSVQLSPPLWHRGIPVRAPYPKQAMSGPDGVKVCLTCHDGAVAGMLTGTAQVTSMERAPDSGSDKRNAVWTVRP